MQLDPMQSSRMAKDPLLKPKRQRSGPEAVRESLKFFFQWSVGPAFPPERNYEVLPQRGCPAPEAATSEVAIAAMAAER